jgi:hypothetical protein
MSEPGSGRGLAVEVGAWAVALGAAALVLAALGYSTRDPDSRLYAEIAARLSERRASEWVAPEGPPGSYIKGLFREHPAGIHFLPAALARAGYPARPAAYAVNAGYQALGLMLLWRVAASCVAGGEARAIAILLQLIPIAFIYRIRANHEAALLLCLLLALYGAERCRRRLAFAGVMAAGLVGLLLVKGIFVGVGFVACGAWLVARRKAAGSNGNAIVAMAVCLAAVGLAAAGYEAWYRSVTGEPFWSLHLGRQLGVAARPRSGALLLEKAANLGWYVPRVLWFAFPWSLVLLASLAGSTRLASVRRRCEGAGRDGLIFVALFSAVCVTAFSLSDRVADRYILPVYYAVGAAGVVLALRAWPRLRDVFTRLDAWHPFPMIAVFILTFALHLLGGALGVPTIKVWAP